MIIKIIIIILILMGLSLYFVVHGSSRTASDDMQKRLDEEQAEIVRELGRNRGTGRKMTEGALDRAHLNSCEAVSEKRYTKNFVIHRDDEGKVIRQFEGIDMKAVYEQKSIAYKFIKRISDIVLSTIGLIVLSPVFLVIAIAIKMEDRGPVIFSGKRWGKDFKYFPMHKFRSMCVDAEARTKEVVGEAEKNGMAFKVKDDPRITKVGKFMRATTLDELPQLWNVFKGQMSLVGPRPIQTTSDEGDPYDFQRWCVKPGITCIWQTCGRAAVPWDEWVEMDLFYIANASVWMDLKLLWRTVEAVIGKHGAM